MIIFLIFFLSCSSISSLQCMEELAPYPQLTNSRELLIQKAQFLLDNCYERSDPIEVVQTDRDRDYQWEPKTALNTLRSFNLNRDYAQGVVSYLQEVSDTNADLSQPEIRKPLMGFDLALEMFTVTNMLAVRGPKEAPPFDSPQKYHVPYAQRVQQYDESELYYGHYYSSGKNHIDIAYEKLEEIRDKAWLCMQHNQKQTSSLLRASRRPYNNSTPRSDRERLQDDNLLVLMQVSTHCLQAQNCIIAGNVYPPRTRFPLRKMIFEVGYCVMLCGTIYTLFYSHSAPDHSPHGAE